MINNIFENSEKWNIKNTNTTGLPRPYFKVNKKYRKRNNKFFMAAKIPVPWQSIPFFDKQGTLLNLNYDNESKVYKDSLCPFCGEAFNNNENAIRWTRATFSDDLNEGTVFSDIYPFHIECMRQARIFCPFMRETKDEEFEYGIFSDLKNNAINHINSLNIQRLEKNI